MFLKCKETKPCFAQRPDPDDKRQKYCKLLQRGYKYSEMCPFRKPVAEVTKGKRYPFSHEYGAIESEYKPHAHTGAIES